MYIYTYNDNYVCLRGVEHFAIDNIFLLRIFSQRIYHEKQTKCIEYNIKIEESRKIHTYVCMYIYVCFIYVHIICS